MLGVPAKTSKNLKLNNSVKLNSRDAINKIFYTLNLQALVLTYKVFCHLTVVVLL